MDATLKMNYVIKFVADMDRAVKFYRDVLGLALKVSIARMERICHRRDNACTASSGRATYRRPIWSSTRLLRGAVLNLPGFSAAGRTCTGASTSLQATPRSAAMHPHFAAPTGIMACS